MSPGTITAAAEVRIFAYSGKLGLPPGVRASARRRPPVSAMTGGINPRYPGKARIHRRASCSWTQTGVSRVAGVPNSSVMQPRADLSESARRQKVPLREPASMPEYPLHRGGQWSKLGAPYTQHTTWDRGRANRLGRTVASRKFRPPKPARTSPPDRACGRSVCPVAPARSPSPPDWPPASPAPFAPLLPAPPRGRPLPPPTCPR